MTALDDITDEICVQMGARGMMSKPVALRDAAFCERLLRQITEATSLGGGAPT